MYTCPKCGQEMIDKKEFCVKCGTKLVEEKKPLKFKNILIVFGIMIVIGIIVCYLIINVGTDDEIEEFLPKEETNTAEDRLKNVTDNTVDEEEKEIILFPED